MKYATVMACAAAVTTATAMPSLTKRNETIPAAPPKWINLSDAVACDAALDETRNSKREVADFDKLHQACGTLTFCKLFDYKFSRPEEVPKITKLYDYKDAITCLTAHAQPAQGQQTSEKLRWKDYQRAPGSSNACVQAMDEKKSAFELNEACGTDNFCQYFEMYYPLYRPEFVRKIVRETGFFSRSDCLGGVVLERE